MKITISGIGGVGKGTISKLLGEKLNYQVLSGGDFFRAMAKEQGMDLYEFEEYVKTQPDFDYKLDKMQEKFGQENDNFVLESRIGWYFVPDSFKIKLICEEGERLRRIKERDGGEIDEIKAKEEQRLKAIKERYKKLYQIDDFQADENFDLIVDTTKLNPDEIVNLILERIK